VREIEGVVAFLQRVFVALVDLEYGVFVKNPRSVALPTVDSLRLVGRYRLNQYGKSGDGAVVSSCI
jgi:hypothetical protein